MEPLLVNRPVEDVGLASAAYRVDVVSVLARIAMMNGSGLQASFFLKPGSREGHGPDCLSARLNDRSAQFIAVRCAGEITLVHSDAIAYVWIGGKDPELEFRLRVGATRRAALVQIRTGEELAGEFLSIMPPDRSRLSDLLNEPGERFLLFSSGGSTYFINRNAIQKASPIENVPSSS
jgi:hypothetical protein